MSVNSKMTAIADEIRELSGTTELMGLDAMATHAGEANTDVATQTELLAQIIAALEGKADGGDLTPIIDALTEKGVEVPEGTSVAGLAELISGIEAGGGGDEKKVKGDITPAATTKTLTITHGLGKIPKYFCIMNTDWFGSNGLAIEKVQYGGTMMQNMLGIVFAGERCVVVSPNYSGNYSAYMRASDDTDSSYAISDINEQTISFDITYYSTFQFEATKHCWEAM